MDGECATLILTDKQLTLPVQSEKDIRESAKIVFLEEYDKLLESDA